MPKGKSIVGKVKNKKFAYFWLLVCGSIGSLLLLIYYPYIWPLLIPSAVLSLLISAITANKTKRPRMWLGVDMVLTIILLMALTWSFAAFPAESAFILMDAMIILGCILGAMNW